MRESDSPKRLSPPDEILLLPRRHILKIEDVYEYHNHAWIVSELCGGGDLLHLLMREGGALSELASRRILGQLLSAVDACHAVGVVHRDLKPENVMLVDAEGPPVIKVIDFGLSCIYRADGQHELHRLAGTPYYMAPEVVSGVPRRISRAFRPGETRRPR